MSRRAWTDDEVAFLQEEAASSTLAELSAELGRPVKMVRWKTQQLGLSVLDGRAYGGSGRTVSVWTEERLAYLREHSTSLPVAQIATHLGVSEISVRHALYFYRIPGRGQGVPRSTESLQVVREKARVRRETRYPPEGPWACLRCTVSKPLNEFNSTGARPSHVCLVCEREARLTKAYALSQEQFDAMLAAQGGVCAICSNPETRMVRGRPMPLSLDHDHACCPGRVTCGRCIRGLLCWECNNVLGKIEKLDPGGAAFVGYLDTYLARGR